MNYQIKKKNNLYFIVDENDNTIDIKRSIGLNRVNDMIFGDAISYYDGKLDLSDRVYIDNPLGEQRIALIGDISNVFKTLKLVMSKNRDQEFVDVCASVIEAINDYFGGCSYIDDRLKFFPTEEEVSSGNVGRGKVSDLEHKGAAYSFARAMLSQNILKTLGYNSGIKISMVKINGKEEAHAYNLVEHENRYFIYDSSMPSLIEERINPVICEITKEVYDSLRTPISSIREKTDGYAVKVNYFNSLTCENVDIVYDYNQENIYDGNLLRDDIKNKTN